MKSLANIWRRRQWLGLLVFWFVVSWSLAPDLNAQNLDNAGKIQNTGGVIRIKGLMTGTPDTINGMVDFYGINQTVPAMMFTKIKASGASGIKTFANGTTVITDSIIVNQTSGGFVAASNDTLDLQKTDSLQVKVISGSFDVSAATVKYTTGNQTILGTTYGKLITSGGNKTISDSLMIANGGTFTNNAVVDFGSSAFKSTGATVLNSGTLKTAGSVTLDPNATMNGTFVYYGANAQTISGITYGNLITSGGNKTISSALIIARGGTFTNSASVDLGTNSFTSAGARVINSGTIQSNGSVTLDSNATVRGTFVYYGANAQTIADANYMDTLKLQGAGTKTINNIIVGNVYTTTGGARSYPGTVTYNRAGDQAVVNESYKNLILTGSGTKTINGTASISSTLIDSVNTTIASGTTSLGGNGTATFYGNLTLSGSSRFDASANGATTIFAGGADTISGSSTLLVRNLTLTGTAAKISNANITVYGTFIPTRGIDMGSSTLFISSNAVNAVGAFGHLEEVKGAMQRSTTTTGTYTMNDSATTVTFMNGAPASFTLNVRPGTNPTAYAPNTHVNRKIIASYSSWAQGSGSMQLNLGYLNSEKPAADENKVRMFKGAAKLATSSPILRTPATADSFGAISLASITPGAAYDTAASPYLPNGTEIILSNSGAAMLSIINNGNWNDPATWDENRLPTSSDDVQIKNINISVSSNATAASLTVDASKSLLVTNANLTITQTVTNNGSITVGQIRTLQVASSGTGTFYNNGTLTIDGTVTVGR